MTPGFSCTFILAACMMVKATFAATTEPETQAKADVLGTPIVEVKIPAAMIGGHPTGEMLYEENCASCHGAKAGGRAGIAPPLVHRIYEPAHHGDAAFRRAVAEGAPQHHWSFGDMPPVPGVDDGSMDYILEYLRAVQRANGID